MEWVHFFVQATPVSPFDAAHYRLPVANDYVQVLDARMTVTHNQLLGCLRPGARICFDGRVYVVRRGSSSYTLTLVDTGIAAAQVAETYLRQAAELVDLTVASADGAEQVISGTPEHPFYVPAAKEYLAMGQLTPGTVLQTANGATATVKFSTRRSGQFDVYNFKVPGEHNYYVAAADGCGWWVLVHNACAPEFKGGRIPGNQFLKNAEEYLGEGYSEVSPGRYISKDGLRQVRLGEHELKNPGKLHGHFEAYDTPGGKVIENSSVDLY